MKKRISFLITILAVVFAALAFTACGAEEEKGTPIDVDIPYASDFTCDYYAADGTKITDKDVAFDCTDDIRVKINFTLSADAYAAGKSRFTVKFIPPEGFTGVILSANTSTTNNNELTAVYSADDKSKKCYVEARLGVNYSSGDLKIVCYYDDEDFVEMCEKNVRNDKTLTFTYDKSLGGYVVSDGYGAFENITLPDSILGKQIKKIADKAFYGCKTLKKIVLPESLEIIGEAAFDGCDNLELTEYQNAYYLGSANNERYCLMRVKDREAKTFGVATGCKIIYDNAFRDCGLLESITLPDTVVSVGVGAFYNCSLLETVVLSDNLVRIGADAFSYDWWIYTHKLTYNEYDGSGYLGSPNNKYLCLAKAKSNVQSFVINEKTRIIYDEAFNGNASLTEVTLHDGITEIGKSAFNGCASLANVTLPNSLTYVGEFAFKGCASLTSVTLPDGLEDVGAAAFASCDNIAAKRSDNGYYVGSASNEYLMLVRTEKSATNCTVNERCKVVGGYAFENSSIVSVTLPAGVTKIGERAFANCASLTSVTLPDGLIYLGEAAFYESTLIQSVKVPSRIDGLSKNLFYGCTNLKSVIIPDNLKSIGEDAFDGCTSLSGVALPSALDGIGERAFRGCTSLTAVTLPSGVTDIELAAFSGCTSLANVGLSDKTQTIGAYAFADCSSLANITLPDGLTDIGERSFLGSGVKSVVIPRNRNPRKLLRVRRLPRSRFRNLFGRNRDRRRQRVSELHRAKKRNGIRQPENDR